MALLAIGTEHVARWANRNGVVQWKSGDPIHFFSIQVGLRPALRTSTNRTEFLPKRLPSGSPISFAPHFRVHCVYRCILRPQRKEAVLRKARKQNGSLVFGRKRKQDPRLDVQLASHSSDRTACSQKKAGRHP